MCVKYMKLCSGAVTTVKSCTVYLIFVNKLLTKTKKLKRSSLIKTGLLTVLIVRYCWHDANDQTIPNISCHHDLGRLIMF